MEPWPWILLIIAIVMIAIYFINLGWFSRHPWPGSTRDELYKILKRNRDELVKKESEQQRLGRKHGRSEPDQQMP